MVLAVRRNSPWSGRSSISRAIVFDRSPWATAPITRAVSMVGWTRSSIRSLTDPTDSRQNPPTSPRESRWLSFPSLPTTRLRRASSSAIRSFCSTTSLKASATLPATPVQSGGRRTPVRPCLSAVSAPSSATISLPFACAGYESVPFATAGSSNDMGVPRRCPNGRRDVAPRGRKPYQNRGRKGGGVIEARSIFASPRRSLRRYFDAASGKINGSCRPPGPPGAGSPARREFHESRGAGRIGRVGETRGRRLCGIRGPRTASQITRNPMMGKGLRPAERLHRKGAPGGPSTRPWRTLTGSVQGEG